MDWRHDPGTRGGDGEIIAAFTEETGVEVELVSVDEDQFVQLLTSAAAAGDLPDVVGSQPLAGVRTMAANELINIEAAEAVVGALDPSTFSERALEFTSEGDNQLAVPTDAWSQLLFYRKDLFDAAGLAAPETYDDITAAAEALDSPEVAGIVAATTPGDAFTQQTFEHSALANGCEMVDDSGEVTMDSEQCVAAFDFFGNLITNYGSPPGRGHGSGELLRWPGRDGHLVDVPARRDGGTAQRRAAYLPRVCRLTRLSWRRTAGWSRSAGPGWGGACPTIW